MHARERHLHDPSVPQTNHDLCVEDGRSRHDEHLVWSCPYPLCHPSTLYHPCRDPTLSPPAHLDLSNDLRVRGRDNRGWRSMNPHRAHVVFDEVILTVVSRRHDDGHVLGRLDDHLSRTKFMLANFKSLLQLEYSHRIHNALEMIRSGWNLRVMGRLCYCRVCGFLEGRLLMPCFWEERFRRS